ncbi:MAG: lysophospholipase, partial [Tannerella sp.]|nr:lysophospholipase [Tannerella sp.]
MKKKTKRNLMWIIFAIILLGAGVLLAVPLVLMNTMLNVHVNYSKTWTAEEYGLEAKHFFVKTDDGLNISTYEVAVESPKAVIICLSGIHNPSATIYFGHARLFRENGFATVILDMRAHGESDGNRIYAGYREWLDVKAAVNYINEST